MNTLAKVGRHIYVFRNRRAWKDALPKHYGSIYLDLDGCAGRLEIMLEYPAWLFRTLPTGLEHFLHCEGTVGTGRMRRLGAVDV